MRYFVTLDPGSSDPPTVVDVKELPTGTLDVTIEGRKIDVDVVSLGGSLSFLVDGKVVDMTTEGTLPELGVIASGNRSYVRVESERQRSAEAAKKAKSGGVERVVKSPMPGRVVKVLVQKGDEVEPGQPLIVIEAMKMENEIKAKAKGKIFEVHAVAGAPVEGNAKLITFE